VVSLWNVEDQPSADLMARFYDGLLRHALPPAAALRKAQLALLGDPDRKEPSSWAGFELQGDWR
jgi:CHAT domain-containing protein